MIETPILQHLKNEEERLRNMIDENNDRLRAAKKKTEQIIEKYDKEIDKLTEQKNSQLEEFNSEIQDAESDLSCYESLLSKNLSYQNEHDVWEKDEND